MPSSPAALKALSLSALLLMASPIGASATSIAAPPQDSQDFEQAWVTGRTNVRSGPGTKYRIVHRLKRGDFVNVGDRRRGWCFVDVYGGNGYIQERVIGEGENPVNSHGPAEPGYIPPQEPGTQQTID